MAEVDSHDTPWPLDGLPERVLAMLLCGAGYGDRVPRESAQLLPGTKLFRLVVGIPDVDEGLKMSGKEVASKRHGGPEHLIISDPTPSPTT